MQNRLALVREQSVSVGHRRQPPPGQSGEPTHAHLHHRGGTVIEALPGELGAGSAIARAVAHVEIGVDGEKRNSPRSLPLKVMCADPARSISSHSHISVIRHRPVKARAKLGARLVMSPRSASAVDQIACGCRKGQRPIADEVNKLARFDTEIHMRTSVSAHAELMVRIHSPPAGSLQTIGSAGGRAAAVALEVPHGVPPELLL